jgi:hypothetical protein
MFPRTIGFGNPFQQFAVNPFQAVNPYQVANPFAAAMGPGGINPLTALMSAQAISPYPSAQVPGFTGINPLFSHQFGWGVAPSINPLIAAQLATTNPSVLPYLAAQSGIAQGEFGSPYNPGQFNPIPQLLGGGIGHFAGQQFAGHPFAAQSPVVSSPGVGFGAIGQQPFGVINPNLLAQALANPATASDPLIGALVAQQLNPLAGQQLPIRSLIGGHQFNPLTSGFGGGLGSITGQVTDPYSTLVQAQLISQLAASPYQQMLRAYTGAPWTAGQGFQPAHTGIGFGL